MVVLLNIMLETFVVVLAWETSIVVYVLMIFPKSLTKVESAKHLKKCSKPTNW